MPPPLELEFTGLTWLAAHWISAQLKPDLAELGTQMLRKQVGRGIAVIFHKIARSVEVFLLNTSGLTQLDRLVQSRLRSETPSGQVADRIVLFFA